MGKSLKLNLWRVELRLPAIAVASRGHRQVKNFSTDPHLVGFCKLRSLLGVPTFCKQIYSPERWLGSAESLGTMTHSPVHIFMIYRHTNSGFERADRFLVMVSGMILANQPATRPDQHLLSLFAKKTLISAEGLVSHQW